MHRTAYISASVMIVVLIYFCILRATGYPPHDKEAFAVPMEECIQVSAPVSGSDTSQDKRKACAVICGSHPMYTTVSSGMTTDGSGVVCTCCDPASNVKLVELLPKSAPCSPNVTYGLVGTGTRTMFVSDGCNGIFQWRDGHKFACKSNAAGERKECPYYDPLVASPGTQRALDAAIANRQHQKALQEERKRLTRISKTSHAIFQTVIPAVNTGMLYRGQRSSMP